MRLLFSTSEPGMLRQMADHMKSAGIKCELHEEPDNPARRSALFYPELWVRNEDFQTAAKILVSRTLAAWRQAQG